MTWQLVGTPKTHRITNKIAKEFADMEPAPQDRPLSERRLQVYERVAREGGFRPCIWAKALCAETDQFYRVNGKHTSTLFSTLDLKELPELFAVVEEYTCDTLEDVARLYATFDSQIQSRNTGDINRAFAATIPELKDIPRLHINLIVSALAADKFGIRIYGSKQAAERAELLFDNVDFALWANEIITPKDAAILRRVPVVAAMKGTYVKSKKAAEEFWCAVRDQTGPSPNTADRKLAKYLMTTNAIQATESARRQRYLADAREFYVKCIHAWNAWRKNETTALQYFKNAKIPSFT